MAADPRNSPATPLVAVALVSAALVHPLPIALATYWPSLSLLALAMIASFFVFDPFLTVPLGFVLRAHHRRGATRRTLLARGTLTGFSAGLFVWLSHEAIDHFVLHVTPPIGDRLAGSIHPVMSAAFGAAVGWLVSRSRRGPA